MNCGRCGNQIGNRIIRYNGVLLCERCAREYGVDEAIRTQSSLFGQAFPMFEELTNSLIGGSGNLEFANTKIRCPRCKMTLREFETGGQVGCIECFNTFNETIMKAVLKRQGSSIYKGRKPGESSDVEDSTFEIVEEEVKPEAVKAPSEVKEETKVQANEESILDFVRNNDLASIDDNKLNEAMLMAAKEEDYKLATIIRDELKKRKEGN